MAKGLYVEACCLKPATLAELQGYLDHERQAFYLDGPNDVDWIYRDQVTERREGALYVDYVAHDDGHRWSNPTESEDIHLGVSEPWAIKTVRHLHDAGVCSAEGLAVVADVWRASPPEPGTYFNVIQGMNHRTLQMMEERGLLEEQPAEVYRWIVSEWQFPLYDLKLSRVPVDLESLREQQRNWSPDGY